MSVRQYSEMTFYSAIAWRRLGKPAKCRSLLNDLLEHALQLAAAPAVTDFFATSLPSLLLFDEDPQARQKTSAWLMQSQARWGLGEVARARSLLARVLRHDPNHGAARDFLQHHRFFI
jgi:hypothetical protein